MCGESEGQGGGCIEWGEVIGGEWLERVMGGWGVKLGWCVSVGV